MKILLDYVFPVSSITPTPEASTAFLKQVCLVVKPLNGGVQTGVIVECATMTAVGLLTANTEAQQFFNASMSKVYILPMDDLGLADAMAEAEAAEFFTLVISSDFDDEDSDVFATGTYTVTSYANLIDGTPDTVTINGVAFVAQAGASTPGSAHFTAATSNDATATSLAAQINAYEDFEGLISAAALSAVVTLTAEVYGFEGEFTTTYQQLGTGIGITAQQAAMGGGEEALDVGTFPGVVGRYRQSANSAATIAAIENHIGFYSNVTNKAKNLCYAIGKVLANALNWTNQQYITMPFDDGVDTLGDAESLFDDKVSFVIADSEFGTRLGLLACGGKAIVAPYIKRNLEVDLQSAALSFISGNQPAYTNTNATLLENTLQDVVNSYIERQWLEAGTIDIQLIEDNFVASGFINIAEPKALWRVFSEIRQTL